jgi:hypothetical protein
MFIAALLTIAKLWKQPRCPTTDEWIKKIWYLHTMEFCSTPNECMKPENIILSEAREAQKAKSHVIPHMQIIDPKQMQ